MNTDPLILIAGGTTESRAAAEALVTEGYRVLCSQATETPFLLRPDPRLRRRTGRLTTDGWAALMEETRAASIVDAGHPHATELREALRAASAKLRVPLLRLERGAVAVDGSALVVATHEAAALMACGFGRRVLVTVGTRHLQEYVAAARLARVSLVARVLDVAESRSAVGALGCDPEHIVYGRGPFTLQQNLELLRRTEADVLVTKDSGKEGGLAEKLEAAQRLGARVIVVRRPEEPADALRSVQELLERLRWLGLAPRALDIAPTDRQVARGP